MRSWAGPTPAGERVRRWITAGGVALALGVWLGANPSVVVAQACPATPGTSCLVSSKSRASIRNNVSDDTRDQLIWKWSKGEGMTQTTLADPTTSSDYTLCIYAGSAQALVGEATIPAGTGWKPLGSKGYGFKGAAPSGLTFSVLKSGETLQASAMVKGRGAGLPDGLLPLAEPVTMQLIKSDSTLCLHTTFSGTEIKQSDETRFKSSREIILPPPAGTLARDSLCNKDGEDGSVAEQVGAQMRRSGSEWASTCLSSHGASGSQCEVMFPGDSTWANVPDEVPSLICPNEGDCDQSLGRIEWHAEDKFIRRCTLDEWSLVWGWVQQRSRAPGPPDCDVGAFAPHFWGVYACYEEHFVLPVLQDQLAKLRAYDSPNPPMTKECEGAIMTRMWWRLASDWIRHGNYECPEAYLDPQVQDACDTDTAVPKIDQATWNAWCTDFAEMLRPVYEGSRAASGKPY